MNFVILRYIYKLVLQSNNGRVKLPSIRALVIKFNISKNDIVKVFNFFKELGILVSEQGSKSYLLKKQFFYIFKGNFDFMFGNKIKRKIISKQVTEVRNGYNYQFERQIIKDNKIISLSLDLIYTPFRHKKVNLDYGVDFYISSTSNEKKIVSKQSSIIDISNFEEYKILKEKYCVILEVEIHSQNYKLLSHSFSLFPIKYYRDYKIEIIV